LRSEFVQFVDASFSIAHEIGPMTEPAAADPAGCSYSVTAAWFLAGVATKKAGARPMSRPGFFR
jgi:hypothetical protein